jgi:hypothetical protein
VPGQESAYSFAAAAASGQYSSNVAAGKGKGGFGGSDRNNNSKNDDDGKDDNSGSGDDEFEYSPGVTNSAAQRLLDEQQLAATLMTAVEAGAIAEAWGEYTSAAFAQAREREKITKELPPSDGGRSHDEQRMHRGIAALYNEGDEKVKTNELFTLTGETSVSATKIGSLALAVGCSETLLRTAFHATVGDLRLSAMHAVARSGSLSDHERDAHTLGVRPHHKANKLKALANEVIEEEYDSSESEQEEEKKPEDKIDTDEENMMFSDNDCPDMTSSEDGGDGSSDSDSDDGTNRTLSAEQMLQLGAEIYLEMKAAEKEKEKGKGLTTKDGAADGGVKLPPI